MIAWVECASCERVGTYATPSAEQWTERTERTERPLDCKSVQPGSTPGRASTYENGPVGGRFSFGAMGKKLDTC